jgi:hypothetical protein
MGQQHRRTDRRKYPTVSTGLEHDHVACARSVHVWLVEILWIDGPKWLHDVSDKNLMATVFRYVELISATGAGVKQTESRFVAPLDLNDPESFIAWQVAQTGSAFTEEKLDEFYNLVGRCLAGCNEAFNAILPERNRKSFSWPRPERDQR